MKKYYWMMGVYLACVFIGAEIYAFVYDVEPSTHLLDRYFEEMSDRDEVITFNEWAERQDRKYEVAMDWFADGCDCALNPWYSAEWHNERNE